MEWIVLALFAVAAALFVGSGAASPSTRRQEEAAEALRGLRERRERLLQELRDLDVDAAEGRISTSERAEGRRALAPELRAVTDALRQRGALDAPLDAPREAERSR